MANILNYSTNKMFLTITIFWFFLTSCEKEPINPSPETPTPVEKRVEWKWNVDLSNTKKELYTDPVLFDEWIILSYISDNENRNLPALSFFNKRTGDKEWEYFYPHKSTEYIRNIKLYQNWIVLKYTDRLICINAETRNLEWEIIYPNNNTVTFAAVIFGEYYYQTMDYFDNLNDFPFNDSVSLMRYHIPTGQQEKLYGERMVKDSGKHPELFPPLVYQDGNRELIIFTMNYLDSGDFHPVDLIAVDTKTKEVVWKNSAYSPLRTAWNTPPYIFDGNVVLASDWSMYSFDAKTGQMNYRTELKSLNNQAGFSFSGPFVHNDKVYAIENNGHVFCLDARFGNILWQITNVGANANGPARGPCNRPIVVDDILYVNTWSDQAFILFDARSGQQLERYRDADYNGGNVVYDEETKTFFVTAQDKLRAFTVKKI